MENSTNITQLFSLYNYDYGIKNFSLNYLKKEVGYNKNKNLKFIKEKAYLEIVDKIEREGTKRAEEMNTSGTISKKSIVFECIRHKIENKCYQGYRHEQLLPVRGQRTRTNAKTNRKKIGKHNKKDNNK
jgi:small subunit ribosomal protein S13